MTPLRSLIIIAFIDNVLTLVLYNYAASQPGGTGAALAFGVLWMPALWLISFVLTMVIVVWKHKTLFDKAATKWTLLALLFCTPIPIYALYQLTNPIPETSCSSSSLKYENGKVYKTEFWYYTSNYKQKYVDMFFIADSISEVTNGDKAFLKDSTWTYFSKTGDTIKAEKYKADKLISIRQILKE